MKVILNLNAAHVARLRELVNANQDRLFEKLTAAVKEGASELRQTGLRDSLKFWDTIDRGLRDAQFIGTDPTGAPVMSHGEAQQLAAFLAERRGPVARR